ncbi:MAG: zinc ribbon domain-containing protein [Chloroflexi bacterium]|nr:zinc ribbon domain-containing protein [Chloroflexota bacterium]
MIAHRLLQFLLVVSLLSVTTGMPRALAQADNEPDGLKNVRLWIYPEYDDPRLLVMLEGQIVGVQAPATVRFLVPPTAEMNAAASADAQGKYSDVPPRREPSRIPGWDEISYEITSNTFRMEYYDPIIRGQPDKTIAYEFRWVYPISELDVVVQEPRKSNNFSVLPRGEPLVDGRGFAFYSYSYRDLDDESPLRFEITYTKTDPNPSLAIKGNGSSAVLLMITGLAGLILGAALLWVLKLKARNRPERGYAAQAAAVRGSGQKRVPNRFCSACGKRLDIPSRFCPYCGAKTQ